MSALRCIETDLPSSDFLAQLYMVAKASQEESGQNAGEGVEIVRNEPFDDKSEVNRHNMPPGQYTYVTQNRHSCTINLSVCHILTILYA